MEPSGQTWLDQLRPSATETNDAQQHTSRENKEVVKDRKGKSKREEKERTDLNSRKDKKKGKKDKMDKKHKKHKKHKRGRSEDRREGSGDTGQHATKKHRQDFGDALTTPSVAQEAPAPPAVLSRGHRGRRGREGADHWGLGAH